MSQTAIEAAEARSPVQTRDQIERILGSGILAAIVLWLLYEAISDPEQFFALLLNGLNNGALYALIALGYTMVYGIIELINFSHGDLFMLATVFAGVTVVTGFGAGELSIVGFGLVFIGLIITMMAAAAVNVAAERVAYRRLRRAPKLAPLITAVGLSFIYQWLGQREWGTFWGTGSTPKQWDTVIGNVQFTVLGIEVRWRTVMIVAVTVPLLLAMTYVVQRTRAGKAMRATAQDQDAARLMGIDVDRTIAFTFALGGGLAGAAGLLWLQSEGTTRFDAGFTLGLYAFTAAVLGGIGNLNGAVIGGFLIGLILTFSDGLLFGSQKWSQTTVFTVLILLMVFRPEGILGKPTTEKV